MSAFLDTGPPGQSASRGYQATGERENHEASDQTSRSTSTRKDRHRQLSRFYRPLVAVWKALQSSAWEELRRRCL